MRSHLEPNSTTVDQRNRHELTQKNVQQFLCFIDLLAQVLVATNYILLVLTFCSNDEGIKRNPFSFMSNANTRTQHLDIRFGYPILGLNHCWLVHSYHKHQPTSP